MIYISVDNGGGEICRENVQGDESVYAAFQRLFSGQGYEPQEGDTIVIRNDADE